MPSPGQNIIVVDDDAGMNQAIERLLNAAGFRTVTFSSGEDLLESGAAASAACLILDLHLPGLSGFDLCRRLRQFGVTLPVIFITAYDDPAAQTEAKVEGAIAYFTKPFPGQSLLSSVTRAVELGKVEDSKCI